MIDFVAKYFYYIFLGLIILTVIQRKYKGLSENKRMATLIASILFFIMYIGALGIKSKNLDQVWILLPLAVDLSLIYVLRNRLFIFKMNCQKCGKKLSSTDILYIDSNLCSDCAETEKPSDSSAGESDESSAASSEENEGDSSSDSE